MVLCIFKMETDINISEEKSNSVNDIQMSESESREEATEKSPIPMSIEEEDLESCENQAKTVISIDGVTKDITKGVNLDLLYKFKEDKFKDFLVLIKEDDEGNAERLKVLQELGGPISLKCLVMNNIEFVIEVRDGIDPAVTETCINSRLAVFGDAELVPMSTENL